ncbi:unnamed protein product [Phaeothamnion confervicola]
MGTPTVPAARREPASTRPSCPPATRAFIAATRIQARSTRPSFHRPAAARSLWRPGRRGRATPFPNTVRQTGQPVPHNGARAVAAGGTRSGGREAGRALRRAAVAPGGSGSGITHFADNFTV